MILTVLQDLTVRSFVLEETLDRGFPQIEHCLRFVVDETKCVERRPPGMVLETCFLLLVRCLGLGILVRDLHHSENMG